MFVCFCFRCRLLLNFFFFFTSNFYLHIPFYKETPLGRSIKVSQGTNRTVQSVKAFPNKPINLSLILETRSAEGGNCLCGLSLTSLLGKIKLEWLPTTLLHVDFSLSVCISSSQDIRVVRSPAPLL